MKNGHRLDGTQRLRCNNHCKKSFLLDYHYNALRAGVKEQNTELTLNASGLRDTERVIKIAKETAIRELKKTIVPTNPYLLDNVSLAFDLGKLGNRGMHFICT
ncbi:hypothetical protein C7N43_26470 [Sphingobacteriales bacterium UPWRP_1]|nr:hypothetical protein B6N25_14110 [Sphingobacteriales bacterium TSM_CSS]PSJ73944.1 hypothetical protein C7N43_26470 [Sphingobacteriales bacterium UPWRP_1]